MPCQLDRIDEQIKFSIRIKALIVLFKKNPNFMFFRIYYKKHAGYAFLSKTDGLFH